MPTLPTDPDSAAALPPDEALFAAIAAGDVAAAATALRQGADPSAERAYEIGGDHETVSGARSALQCAVHAGHPGLVDLLLARGAAVDARDPASGSTALIEAARLGSPRIVVALLAAGASTALVDGRSGEDAFAAAIGRGHADVVSVLLAAGCKATPRALALACHSGRSDLAEACLRAGVGPATTPVLDVAARAGRLELVQWLVAHGAALAVEGPAALREAANAGHAAVVAWLLQRGVPADTPDVHGWTPLMFAAYNGNAATVAALLDAGADPRRTDLAGNTALGWASSAGRDDSAALLAARDRSPAE